jgi:hypothetical protein
MGELAERVADLVQVMIAARSTSTIVAASTMKRVTQRSRFPGCMCIARYASALQAERPQQQLTDCVCEIFGVCCPAARHLNVKLARRLHSMTFCILHMPEQT